MTNVKNDNQNWSGTSHAQTIKKNSAPNFFIFSTKLFTQLWIISNIILIQSDRINGKISQKLCERAQKIIIFKNIYFFEKKNMQT